MTKKGVIQWENGLGGLGGFKRIFLDFFARILRIKPKKKSVSIRPIRPIRSPIVSHPFLPCTEGKNSVNQEAFSNNRFGKRILFSIKNEAVIIE
jgi:hypothetical protein